jgi:general secretion pathway protein A
MYKTFFHLNKSPFEVSPDPYFMYATPSHREAFAGLYYGICSHKGFMVMTGEVGTGKTMVLRCLTDQLEKIHVQYAYIFNPLLSPDEFLRYMLADFNLRVPSAGKNEVLLELYGYLTRREKAGETTVLIIDEAHLLSSEVLEEVRLLGNLENQRSKLLQIALVGQPELDSRLDSPGLRQLKQRIALRCQLQPLTLEQTGEYINWRLARAGSVPGPEAPVFVPGAIGEIFEYSQGYPRLINTICENVLIFACGADSHVISEELTVAACKDLRMERRRPIAPNGGGAGSSDSPSPASKPESRNPSSEFVSAPTATESVQARSAPEVIP